MKTKAKKRCIDCHFFAQGDTFQTGVYREIAQATRDQIRRGDELTRWDDAAVFGCKWGQWLPRPVTQPDKWRSLVLDVERKKSCFYADYQEDTAFDMVKQLAERDEIKSAGRKATIAIIIAFGSIVVSILIAVFT